MSWVPPPLPPAPPPPPPPSPPPPLVYLDRRGATDITVGGSGWQHETITTPPRIFVDRGRLLDAITGLAIGSADSATIVARLPGESYFDGLSASLVRRAVDAFGVGAPWFALYS